MNDFVSMTNAAWTSNVSGSARPLQDRLTLLLRAVEPLKLKQGDDVFGLDAVACHNLPDTLITVDVARLGPRGANRDVMPVVAQIRDAPLVRKSCLAASIEHPRSGSTGVFKAGFGLAFCAFANQTRFAILHFQAQWTTEGHRW